MREKIFAVDLGSKLLKMTVGEEDESGKITLLTKITKNLDSFSDGEIIDQENFIEEAINPLKEIAYQLNSLPKNLILSFSAPYFSFQRTKNKISVSERYVTDEDIRKCLLIAKASLASGNYEVLFEESIAYFLDGANIKVRDPLGMEARTLEVDFFVIQGLKSALAKIKDFFEKNELKVSLILPNPLPASLVLFSKKEKEQGVILIDFGYRIFNLSIFQEGKLNFYQNFKFGAGDLWEDLALDFGLSVDEVYNAFEEIKNLDDKKKKLPIKFGKQKISYSNLVKFIEKRFNFYWKKNGFPELFKKIKENYRLPGGVYLIGGGSYLPEIDNIFRKHSGYLTKLEADIYKNLEQEERIYLNALGSIYYYQKLGEQKSLWSSFLDIFRGLFR